MKTKRILLFISISILSFVTSMGRDVRADLADTNSLTQEIEIGSLTIDQPFEYTFYITNTTSEVLQISRVEFESPLKVVTKSKIPPGERSQVMVTMGKLREIGDFYSQIGIRFKGTNVADRIYAFSGKIVSPLEFDPLPAFFMEVGKGQEKTSSIQIKNHLQEPLQIRHVDFDEKQMQVELKTIVPERHYELSLTLKPSEEMSGRFTNNIHLITSSRTKPVIEIPVYINVRDRIHTFPDHVDFGMLSHKELMYNPELSEMLQQTLMIYQTGGTNFQVSVRCDVPFINVEFERARSKDRFQINLSINPALARPGVIKGSVIVKTNDPEFRQIHVPVSGVIRKD